ncbi:hypothetical protein EC844_109102 [Acinetobacter calcoaceticus]|uniref:Tetratricopeptide repeat protein n=1 Tax=Acinetobacter calcoaceticus TaxID=471 RepID=A0A4R1XXJ4_ACICA|nr:hypothetical protein EC844_109102 [Acinetobacter calcoaceticus]
MKLFKNLFLGGVVLSLVGCQLFPTPSSSDHQEKKPLPSSEKASDQSNAAKTPDSIKIIPYDRDEIKRHPLEVKVPLQQAQSQKFDDGQQLPAYKQLMQQAQKAYSQGQWAQAEQSAMQAQRLAPQSAETFLYLAMVANQTNQAKNAESLARRGLSYAQSNNTKKQLWQAILKSGQQQNAAHTVQEASLQLSKL